MKAIIRTLIYAPIFLATMLFFAFLAKAQKPVILENHPPLNRNANLIVNGSFEEPHLTGGSLGFFVFDGVDGDGYYYFSTGTTLTPFAVPDGWVTSGGGPNTYGQWGNNFEAKDFGTIAIPETGIGYSDPNIHGDRAIYLGNQFVQSISETPTFAPNGEVVFTSPPKIIPRPGYGTGLTVTQTVAGLIPGERYRLSFWVSSEYASGVFADTFTNEDGIFGLQIEDYELLYLTTPAGGASPGNSVFGFDQSHTYVVEFVATREQMDISFINWGHYQSEGLPSGTVGWTRSRTTEYVMDDVILNLVNDDPTSIPTASEWGLIFMTVFMGLIAVYMLRRRNGGREGVGV